MKKYISTLLAFFMVFSLITVFYPASIFAEEDDDIGKNIPEDAFDGNFKEVKGSDGSVTSVFDNGSVITEYKDGSKTGVDYKGNQYSKDKDGNQTIRSTDGYTATEYKDGRKSLTEPNGKTTTINPDGSFSESYRTGLTNYYNSDGGLTGIGITGGESRIETDENGYYKNGEITGPNGTNLKVTDDGIEFTNSEGTVYNHKDLGDKQTILINKKDGSRCEVTTTTTWANGKKTENTDYTLTESNGNRWDSILNISYDKNGNPIFSNNNVSQFTGADGSTFWVDNNSKAVEYKDKNGNSMITDINGNLIEYKDGKNSWNINYDENGNISSADITYPDGGKLIKKPDGTTTMTLPDGTKYESDGKGNVTKDGVQIKQEGKWLPGKKQEEANQKNTYSIPAGNTSTFELGKGVSFEMVKCPAGSFMMGSPKEELRVIVMEKDEELLHQVTISKPFYIGKYEVTQAQYEKVMGKNPSKFKCASAPVDMVTWEDAEKFCEVLNASYAYTIPVKGYKYALPTEAQWEYACRAGSKAALNSGKEITIDEALKKNKETNEKLDEAMVKSAYSDKQMDIIGEQKVDNMFDTHKNLMNLKSDNLDEVAWYKHNSKRKPHPVGLKKPNAWGIYDMHGNAGEWCGDWYYEYTKDAVTDPVGKKSSDPKQQGRVVRGGSFAEIAMNCRSASRAFFSENSPHPAYTAYERKGVGIGFRVVLIPID